MESKEYIAITDFCTSHEIDPHLVMEFWEHGLIQIIHKNNARYIPIQELPKAEKIVRLYLDLEINLEGIEVIDNLLDRLQKMQREITTLKNRLYLYE